MREYYSRPGVTERMRATARRSRERNIERVRAYDRGRGFRGDPFKTKVRNAARVLVPEPCEVCGDKAERHHPDYTQPLLVKWLCRRHHAEVHHVV